MARKPKDDKHPAIKWARDVLAGRIVAGELVKQTIRRHFDDLKNGHHRGLVFDPKAGQHILDFFSFLRHSKGEWYGQTFDLSPWQQFSLYVLFGWKRIDGTRRFRIAYFEIARKNGKSTIAAGVGLYLFFGDQEPGAEVYAAATKKDQARIVHGEAVAMVKASPPLRARIKHFKDNLCIESIRAKFEPLGADEDTMDGLNVHGAIIDELHAHKTRGVYDVIETATGARRQPLVFNITTAGTDRTTICWELHDYAEKVLSGVVHDDAFFGFIAALDAEDDWTNPDVWIKANPNLGVSVKVESLKEQCEKAKQLPTAQNAFRRLRLNQWTQATVRWILLDQWDRCAIPVDAAALAGRECYGGLDLASSTDIAAFVLVFQRASEEEPYPILPFFWIPKENMVKRSQRDRVPYEAWTREGFIESTEGNVIDYAVIKKKLVDLSQIYDIREVAFDRWGAVQLSTELQDDGFTMVQFGQGYASMSGPSKEFEKLILSRHLAHAGNPVLRWMADNAVVKMDPAGNIKPDRQKSREKIDGIVAAIMALDRTMRHPMSVYEDEGLKTI